MAENFFERQEKLLQEERNVFLKKYDVPVRTDLTRADEIEYATDTQILNKPKENYFAMMDFEEPTEKTASDTLKSISLHSLAAGIAPGAYAAYMLNKNPITRGLGGAIVQTGRQASAYMIKEAATLGVAAGMDIDTRMKEHAKIDEEKANLPASLRFHDKVMGDVKRAGKFLTPFEPIDVERVKERAAALSSEQKKVDELNGKVKIVVDNFMERTGLARTEKDGFWYDLGAAGGSILTSIALLAITRNPMIGAAIFGAAEGQGTYEEAIAAGVTPEKAYGLGKINATWIAATEMLGDKFLSKLLYGKGVLGKYSKKILESVKKGKMPSAQDVAAFAVGSTKAGGIEFLQETSQNIGSDIIGKVGGISEKSALDIIKDGFYSGLLALPFGLFGGGVASLANFRQYADNVSKSLQDAGMEKETADKIGREMALTVTSSEFVDDSIKAVSSEINSPLTAEDRDPQKFAQVLTEAQKREIEQESWNVGEKVEQDALKAGVAPEVAEASGRVAQALNNNFYTLAKITPSEQKNFNISVLRAEQQNVQTTNVDFSSLDSMFKSLPKETARMLHDAILADPRVINLLDKGVAFREEISKKAKRKTISEYLRDDATQEEKTAWSNLAKEVERTELAIAKEWLDREKSTEFNQPHNYLQSGIVQRDMFATHNMNLAGAKQAVKMGGLAMPSMAIRKTDSERVAEFGDVSFVGNENLVKPSRSTEVYDRDAWTPSIYNSLRYRLSKNAKQKIEDILKKTGEEKQRSMYVYNIEEYFSDATRNEMALDLFLKEKGLPEEERQKKWNSPEYISWYNETFFDDATPYLFTENDDNTDMVERKFTLNNVMKVLRKQERAAGGYIGDHLFSVQELIKFFPQKFRNLKELRAKKQNLQTTEQIFEKIEELDKDFDSLIAELRTSGEEKEYGADRHAVGIAIANTGDLETQKHWLHNAGLPSDNETISKINKFAERIKNEIPVSYFEAKPRKVVDFGQFSGVIMPNTKDYDGLARDLETKYSLPVFRIEKGNAQQYKEALSEIQKQVPTTFFQSGFHGKVFGELPEIKKESRNKKADVAILPEFQSILNEEIQTVKLTETYSDDVLFTQGSDFRKYLHANLEEIEGKFYVSSGSFKALVSNGDVNKMLHTSNNFSSNEFKKMNRYFVLQLKNLLPNSILAKKYADLNGKDELAIERRFVAVEYDKNIYIVKLTLKESSKRREEFSKTVYEENGNKDFGEYNVEIVKKITSGHAARTLKKRVQPAQRSKDSISNNAPNVKGVTWAQALEGVVDNSGAYLPEVKVYNQNQESPRGMVEIDEQAHEAIIRVFENSDPSTIIHELAHIYLTMINNAANVSMDPEFQQLVSDINAWLGEPAGENGSYSTEQQETFARAFEGYMAEGKSPNKEMEGIFEKFAKWLAEVYESVKDYLQITPEVRSIFDRLLTTEEPVKKSKYVGNSARARELLEAIKTGFKNEDSLELGEMKALLKTTSTRRPRKPKDNLLKDLKKHGAEYANAGQIDKEAYANAGVKDKKGGIDDKPDLWLQKMGYMDFEESTDETVAAAWDMIQDALDGKEVYRLEDQDRIAQIEAYDENLKLLQEIFPDMMESANTKRLISELESQGYRIVEKKDIKNLEKALDILTETENKKDEKQLYKAANRVRREVISEIEKRQLEGKQGMLMLLENAKSAEEIRSAVEGVLEQVEKAYESTEEAKQEKEMLAVPNTDYGKLKIQILKDINQINKDTSSKLQEAEKRLSDLVRNGNKSDPEVQAEIRDAKQIIEQLRGAPYERAIRAALAGIRHLPAADKGKFMRSFMGAKYKNFLPSELDSLLARAKEIEENNYKKHMIEKIQDLLKMNLFDKKGSLKKALFDPNTMNALAEMKRAMRLTPEQAAEELNARMERFVETPASPTDRIVNELLSILANDIKDISTTLCKQTYDDISALRKAGKSKMNLEKMIMDFRTEEDKKTVLAAIKKNKKAGTVKKMYASWLANWESILDLCTDRDTKEEYSMLNLEADAITHNWERRTDIMDGVRDIYRLGRNKDVYAKMNELLDEKHVFMNYSHVDRNPDPAAIKKTGEAFEEELTKMQIITLYIWSKNDILADRLVNQYGWDQLKNMFFEILDSNDRKLGDFLQQEAEKSYNEINAVFVKERGYDLPKVQAYFPSKTERVESELDFLQAAAGTSKNPSFIKARASSSKIQMKPENPFSILFRHIERATDYHYKAEKLNRIRRVFKSPVIKPAFIKQFGEDVYNRMLDMIDQFSVTKPRINYDMDKLGDWLTNNYVKGAIALKPTVGLKQLVSSVNYAENMPSHLWAKGFIEAWMHPKKTVKFMMEGDPYLKARFESGSMNEALSRAIADAKAIGVGKKFVTLTDLLTLNTRLGDMGAICFGGKAYVDYLINVKGMSKADAFAEFRKATLRSQQSNTRSSLSTLQAKDMNFLVRGLFAFKNTPAQYARKIADAIWEYQRGEISAAQLGKVVAIYALINSWLYNMLTTLGLLAYFNDDDESEEIIAAELFFGPFVQMAGCLPILDVAVAAAAEVLQAKAFGRRPRLKQPELPAVGELFALGQKALKEDLEGKDVMEMLATAGHLFVGLPAQYMKGFAFGTKDLVTGENPMRGFLMMLGYTERRARIATGTRED